MFSLFSSRNSADLKPENLMLSCWNEEEAEVKLVDFGCALIVSEDGIDEKLCPSTPVYDPPEKIINDSAPNFQSDVWAAGCILYIILTGTHVSILYAVLLISLALHKLTVCNISAAF